MTMSSVTRHHLAKQAAYPHAAPQAIPDQSTWTDPRNGGGYGQAQLTHALGAALWLTGLRGESVFALMKAVLDAPVEHYDACALRYTNGAIGTMAGAAAHTDAHDNRHQLAVRALGSEGEFQIDIGRDWLWFQRADGFASTPELEPGALFYDCDAPPNALVDLALGKDVQNCSPGELGARSVEILDAAYRSARSGQLEQVSRG
jgi:predicted dehydrogenase